LGDIKNKFWEVTNYLNSSSIYESAIYEQKKIIQQNTTKKKDKIYMKPNPSMKCR